MICPKCDSDKVYVRDTMNAQDGKVYRRRYCKVCGTKFRTVEVLDDGSDTFKNGYLDAVETKNPRFRSTK